LLGVVSAFTEVLDVEELFERAASPYVGHAANLP